ncbi:type VI secretion system baseplate subunit TssF [Elizabethkingia anophelis]|uniref:type VI secretion system baseplate subunit TssF n=1 Tax=Elizabethkingia anophelis TaxID=1117645 RepID=UPI00136A2BD2|nr:type VI secretion system baseplate subunit TssF [Elizabethkingia anophelis]MYY27267.1 hypothetical protein [Elizabethkingia anophelis]
MSQDKIKDRILRRAAMLWGYNEVRAGSTFDPIVNLLLSAVASELEKLEFELESSNARIIERILEIIFPEEISGAVPSRSLLQVFPIENNTKISLNDHFRTNKKSSWGSHYNDYSNKDIYFCPTIEVELTTAKIEYLAHGKTIKQLEDAFSSIVLHKSEAHIPSGELWVGIRTPNKQDLENLMFYIDINNNYQKELLFYYIKHVRIYFNEHEYELINGYNVSQECVDFENIINRNHLELEYIYEEVNKYYSAHYYTLKEKIVFNDERNSGNSLFKYFPDSTLPEENDLLWLKFSFPETVEDDILDNITILLNCVPVINIYNTKTYRRAKGILDILPIQSEDYFLSLEYVSDDTGKRFDLKPYYDEGAPASVVLRKGGVSRFDKRNASELLQYLLELIKDETSAFSAIGGDSVKEMLVVINQNMTALHQLAKEKNFSYSDNPYLIIISSTLRSETSYNISYWNTQAEEANYIRQGTLFVVDNIGGLACERNPVMINTSFGGRKSLSSQDKILEFRSALLSRGRVVTIADIKEFALNHFKNTIVNVDVRKGTKKEIGLKEGFSRTLDIYLFKNQEIKDFDEDEWKYLCNSFLLKLKNVSANMSPYRVFES